MVPVRDGVVDSPGMEAGERPKGGVYCPRNRRASALYQCVDRHGEELRAAGAIHRAVEEHVLERYIGCGDLHRGFAQIRCKRCGRNYLLAFSCKTRFCPACHQRRMLLHAQWVEEHEGLLMADNRPMGINLPGGSGL